MFVLRVCAPARPATTLTSALPSPLFARHMQQDDANGTEAADDGCPADEDVPKLPHDIAHGYACVESALQSMHDAKDGSANTLAQLEAVKAKVLSTIDQSISQVSLRERACKRSLENPEYARAWEIFNAKRAAVHQISDILTNAFDEVSRIASDALAHGAAFADETPAP